jgi:hypothetical protein
MFVCTCKRVLYAIKIIIIIKKKMT